MARRTKLEIAIEEAAKSYALVIVEAVKSATLEELLALQSGEKPTRGPKRAAAKPKAKAKRGPGRPPKAKSAKKAATKATAKKVVKKKRVVKNYPKCAFPGCEKNRFPRGKGFCGDHHKEFLSGKIKSSDSYKS